MHPLSVPLLQAASGETKLFVRASRDIAAGADELRLRLPAPRANTVGPATVIIVPAENVELVPTVERIRSLNRQPNEGLVEGTRGERNRLVYRGEVASGLFEAAFRVQPQSIACDVVGELDFDGTGVWVDETLEYVIEYEPADSVLLDVPAEIGGVGTWYWKWTATA